MARRCAGDERMVERDLWRNPHEHPEATVAAAIASEIGRHASHSDFCTASGRAFTVRRREER
jgi:hypothetical protein